MVAVNDVAETNVVGTGVPANVTVEPDRNCVPETAIVRAAFPALAEVESRPPLVEH